MIKMSQQDFQAKEKEEKEICLVNHEEVSQQKNRGGLGVKRSVTKT